MTEMIRRFLRQKFGSVAIVISMSVLALLSVMPLLASGGQSGTGASTLVLFVLAAASVSKDASSGALQMILARPITRSAYLFGRYFGILAAYAAFLLAVLLLALALARIFGSSGGPQVNVASAGIAILGEFLEGILIAAILVFFSTFLPGYADLLGYFLLLLLLQVPQMLSRTLSWPWLTRFGQIAQENLHPSVPWDEVLRGDNVLRAATGRYVLAVTAFLLLASVVFARREFAYGQD
ncbi:MAG: hypothetical protein ACRD1B_06305 [Thermoanaerobaculia bacterium]